MCRQQEHGARGVDKSVMGKKRLFVLVVGGNTVGALVLLGAVTGGVGHVLQPW